jgi:dolichol-phosphate mannosyltransferase
MTRIFRNSWSQKYASYAEAAGATVLRSGVNRGMGAVIRHGIDYAMTHGYEIVVIVSGLHMPLRRLGTRAYMCLFFLFCGRRVTDASSGFRAIKVSLFEDKRINLWQAWLDRYELEPYLLFKALRLRHKVVEVPVTIAYPKRDGSYTQKLWMRAEAAYPG